MTEFRLVHDDKIQIAVGKSRKETSWKNVEFLWSELVQKLSKTIRTHETHNEFISFKKDRQNEIKDVGGFVGGCISGGRRKTGSIVNRRLITLDVDFGDMDMLDDFDLLYGCACVMYSTHKHSAASPRLRLIIPLDRAVFADEYQAISRRIAGELGIDKFDDTTFEPHRLMYWPSSSLDGEYIFKYIDAPWLCADSVLESYFDWQDTTNWPESNRVTASVKREIKKQGDPLEKKGLIGAFCRCYTIENCIETFLSDVYEPCNTSDRYTYKEGSTAAGLVLYEGKFAYSHHGTDPVSGKLCNAFDLVRIHKFGLKDEDSLPETPAGKLPSFRAMTDFCMTDIGVKKQLAAERISEARNDFESVSGDEENTEIDDSWQEKLDISKKGDIESSLKNLILIMENDPKIKNIVFNQLSDGMEKIGIVPWKSQIRWWRDADDAQLISYIDSNYTSFSQRNYDIAVTKVTDDRAYHPIRLYFDKLPSWDGVERIDTLFIDYLDAQDNDYVKAVTRKTLCAAVARVITPGCKFDSMPVLTGGQGIGKSTLIAKLAMAWFSDSLQLSDTHDKTAAEKLQGYWIIEIGELAGLRKAEIETLRGFLSRQNDVYRASFGRRATPHPRQCVFIGTSNSEEGYLRDTTGNRRFWPVKVTGNSIKKPWDLEQEDIDQIWAEALTKYSTGEKLFLEGEVKEYAEQEQREAMEADPKESMVRTYLDTLLPENWKDMDEYQRRAFLQNDDFGGKSVGTIKRKWVCSQEIWAECFGKNRADMTNRDSIMINSILAKFPDWEKSNPIKFPIYGNCRGYKRKEL